MKNLPPIRWPFASQIYSTEERGAMAFRRLAEELAKFTPLRCATDEYLKQQWDLLTEFEGDRTRDGHHCDDIHLELNRRGLGEYCAV